ncbi:S-layer homology domain-containing protein [Paenibacillus planticolens]|uniref:S-layer homology domain-containing protein n=1 Tax=Paenibacillus planticolens TaxID=2654976 RepID=A0ABX1ZNH5_9BACL|nr:S-layer homology domain-containing protein [Paenibacillus planticolens]NOV01645.1 S-layer homology domain-containing protein [Paenibacillus planticolens]
MKNNKKALAALTITATVGLSAILPFNAFAANPFADAASSSQVQTAIEQLAQQQVLSGYADHSFLPNQAVTRAEIAKMAALALHVNVDTTATTSFVDVTKADWFYSYAAALESVGAMSGTDGQFQGSRTISSEQLADVVAKALQVEAAVVKQLPSFASLTSSPVTRGQAALLIFEAQQLAPIHVTKLEALNAITLQVTFSAPIPAADLELEPASKNFVFDNGLAISNVPRLKTGATSTYIIPVPTQKPGTTYTLTYKGKPAGTFTAGTEKIALASTQQLSNDSFEVESHLADGVADYGYVIAAYAKSRPGSFIVDENNNYNGTAYQILSSMRNREVQITPEGGTPMTAKYLRFTQATDGRQAPKFLLPNGETFKPGVTYTVSADWATLKNATFTAKDIAPLTIQSASAVDAKTINVTLSQDPKDEIFVSRRVTLTGTDGTVLTAEYTLSSRKGAAGTFGLLNNGQLVPGMTYSVAPVGGWATASGVSLTAAK